MYIKRNKAFTLVELIVTLSVLAVIATIAVPSFQEYQAKQEANSIFHKIAAINRYARSQSAILRQNIVICPTLNLSNCQANQWSHAWLVFVDQNRNRQVDAGETVLQIDQLKLKYGQLDWSGALSIPSVSYQAQTNLPIGSNGSVYYCSLKSAKHYKIVLSKMGHLRKEDLTSCS
ncbi:GspH/FimT family pseudopilin [Acinetobacter thermotolerans]|uniref:GspH/FimT family pseudopilin n=1 Tax=Acinetobacter thermotolerans TaxID=3151487 RepID=UPI00325A9842